VKFGFAALGLLWLSSCATASVLVPRRAPAPIPASGVIVGLRASAEQRLSLPRAQVEPLRDDLGALFTAAKIPWRACELHQCGEDSERSVGLVVDTVSPDRQQVEVIVVVNRFQRLEDLRVVFEQRLPLMPWSAVAQHAFQMLTTPQEVTDVLALKLGDASLEPGVELATAGHLAEANTFFERAVREKPQSLAACWNSAICQESIGLFSDAEKTWKRCAGLDQNGRAGRAIREFTERQAQRAE
jgi:hypothetical protein